MKTRPSMIIQWLSIFSMFVAGWLMIILEDPRYFFVVIAFLIIFIIGALWHRNIVED